MKVQLLHIADCPNWEETGVRLRDALNSLGKSEVAIDYVLLNTPEEAAGVPFAGSPTILIDGKDPFPSDGPITDIACRVYNIGGKLSGSPTTEQIVAAIRGRGWTQLRRRCQRC